jgi:predicted MFS family arabinose efflux permease
MQSANPRRWSALAVIALAQFIVIMDTSIIGVALPEIQADLGFSPICSHATHLRSSG